MKSKLLFNQVYYHENSYKNYFEGWYYKQVSKDKKSAISFIVGISKSSDSHVFIQVIESINNKSYYEKYNINDFEYSCDPFYIKIKDSFFSLDKVVVNIKDIEACFTISNLVEIDKSIYAPNIMGPFAYFSFMECNHGVVSLKHDLNGFVKIRGKTVLFDNGIGYIEKDYGISFPTEYIWLQSNTLVVDKDASVFFSSAVIPFLGFKFNGLISILQIGKKQYRFSSYNFGKVKKVIHSLENGVDFYLIEVKQFSYVMKIKVFLGDKIELVSPNKGMMKDKVLESLNSRATVSLYKRNKEIFCSEFINCGSEFMLYK